MPYLKFNNLADYADYLKHANRVHTHLDLADLSDAGAINLHLVATALDGELLVSCSELVLFEPISPEEAEAAPKMFDALRNKAADKVAATLRKRTTFFKQQGLKVHRGILTPQPPVCLLSK